MSSSQLAQSYGSRPFGSYSRLASEYYDAERHPTCASFRCASRALLKNYLANCRSVTSGDLILEVGAGRSLLADILMEMVTPIKNLVISDISKDMIAYSDNYESEGAKLIIANSENIPFRSESVSLLIAILGDPYNTADFWKETARVLCKDGGVIFTTPSYLWAARFRAADPLEIPEAARFMTACREEIMMPSFVFPPSRQIDLAQTYGLVLEDYSSATKASLGNAAAPKLNVLGPHEPVVDAYQFRKP